jgi:PhzF family phenazine biosynthesis protein
MNPEPSAIYQVDSFATQPFMGNPAAVCLPSSERPESWLQNVAAEMNLSETAFVWPQTRANAFLLRWFTPTVEVRLCGHATLAAAHVLWSTAAANPALPIEFETASCILHARLDPPWIELDFPAFEQLPTVAPQGLLRALGIAPNDVVAFSSTTNDNVLIELRSESAVRLLQPDFASVRAATPSSIIVTAAADSEDFDFVSRYFAPSHGIEEDPVTGSAHCDLGPYWQARLGKGEFVAFQASKRGGTVRVRVEGHRVHLGGQAKTVMIGELRV